ncbi:RRP40 [Candida theae]|uniref:RRP40 n=1 Tax=Candida theae TaxID=1198502 RepID=A0AAD5G0P0_9ASCO|nr:RRP40 [Candida theae]KAI5966663.1 RRP40 [Candida theae]
MSSIILPGDSLPIEPASSTKTKIGPGIYKEPKSQNLIPSTAGILHVNQNQQQHSQLVYIESNTKRYIPHNNDFVIGTVVGSIGDYYKVSLQDYSAPVLLSFMAFPNASRKNRPNLTTGQVVYARVVNDDNDSTFETELECFDASNNRETGGFGVLDDSGYVFDVPLNFARELLFNPKSPVLEFLASRVQFEIAVGINGKIWLKCSEGLQSGQEQHQQQQQQQLARGDGGEDGDGEDARMRGLNEAGDDAESLKARNVKNLKATLWAVEYLKRSQSSPTS